MLHSWCCGNSNDFMESLSRQSVQRTLMRLRASRVTARLHFCHEWHRDRRVLNGRLDSATWASSQIHGTDKRPSTEKRAMWNRRRVLQQLSRYHHTRTKISKTKSTKQNFQFNSSKATNKQSAQVPNSEKDRRSIRSAKLRTDTSATVSSTAVDQPLLYPLAQVRNNVPYYQRDKVMQRLQPLP